MKNLFIVAAVLFMSATASAHNLSASSDWSTIKSHFSKVIVEEPSVKLDHGPMTSAFFVCKAGDSLRTKKQLKKCVKWSLSNNRDRDNRRCLEEVKYFGYAAIEGTSERCTKWRNVGSDHDRVCVAYETYSYTLPLSHEVNVFSLKRGGNRDNRRGRKLFTKTLSIEDCE